MSQRKNAGTTTTEQTDRKLQILALNTGTFCDGQLLESYLEAFRGRAKIDYFTDQNIVPRESEKRKKTEKVRLYRNVHTYNTPSYVYTDPLLCYADTDCNPLLWSLLHPFKASKIEKWAMNIAKRLHDLEMNNDYDCVIIVFSLFSSLMAAEKLANAKNKSILSLRPHYMMYLYPGAPNASIPWLFDRRMRDPTFPLYASATTKIVHDSWDSIHKRAVMIQDRVDRSKNGLQDVRNILTSKNVHHITCWDPALIRPLKKLIPNMKMHTIGSPPPKPSATKAPRDLLAFLRKEESNSRPVAFVSFGSYSGVRALDEAGKIVSRLFISNGEGSVVLHVPSNAAQKVDWFEDEIGTDYEKDNSLSPKEKEHLYVARGHVPYEEVVPRVSLVVFTGSMCLQLVCHRSLTPMLMVPYLTEQYFWAKNYESLTGVPYVDVKAGEIGGSENLEHRSLTALQTLVNRLEKHVFPYLKSVKDQAESNNSLTKLRSKVESDVKQFRRGK